MKRSDLKKGDTWQEAFELLLKDIDVKEKKNTKLEKTIAKMIKQSNIHARFIRSLKANVTRLDMQLTQLDRKLSTQSKKR